MKIYDLSPDGEGLTNLREMMRRIIRYNEKQQSQSAYIAPVFNCFVSRDGTLRFEALIMTADVRKKVTMLLNEHEDELNRFTDALMTK